MKKIIGTVLSVVLLAGAAVAPASAQTSRRGYNYRAAQGRRYDTPRRVYYDRRSNGRSFLERHRDKVTVAGGAGAGAVIGGLAGGKKGAIIGALLGAGGSALYTYKLRDRNNRSYYRRR